MVIAGLLLIVCWIEFIDLFGKDYTIGFLIWIYSYCIMIFIALFCIPIWKYYINPTRNTSKIILYGWSILCIIIFILGIIAYWFDRINAS